MFTAIFVFILTGISIVGRNVNYLVIAVIVLPPILFTSFSYEGGIICSISSGVYKRKMGCSFREM